MAKSATDLRTEAAKLQAKAKELLRQAGEVEAAEDLVILRQLKKAGKLDELKAMLAENGSASGGSGQAADR